MMFTRPQVCQHTHAKMREWGAEAVTSLVRSALNYDHKPPLTENTVSIIAQEGRQRFFPRLSETARGRLKSLRL